MVPKYPHYVAYARPPGRVHRAVPPNYPLTDRLHSISCDPALAGGDRMKFDQLKRREFITLISGAAAAWPLAAGAQQRAIPIIGWLRAGRPAPADRLAAFRQGLNDLGYIEGRNVAVERRDSDQYDRLPELASELVRDQVTAVFADNLAAAVSARAATATIPIVFAVGGDPVRDGLVTSLSRPTGNLTGVTYFAGEVLSKRLELMRELVPTAEVIARSSTRTIRICRHDCEMRRRLHE